VQGGAGILTNNYAEYPSRIFPVLKKALLLETKRIVPGRYLRALCRINITEIHTEKIDLIFLTRIFSINRLCFALMRNQINNPEIK
jgi:hypothetical protein